MFDSFCFNRYQVLRDRGVVKWCSCGNDLRGDSVAIQLLIVNIAKLVRLECAFEPKQLCGAHTKRSTDPERLSMDTLPISREYLVH